MSNQTNENISVVNNSIFDLNVSIHAKMVYLFLNKLKNKDNTCFPCHYTISQKCSCGITKVKSAINELITIGLLQKENRFNNTKRDKQSQTSNLYTILGLSQTMKTEQVAEKNKEEVAPTVVENIKLKTTPQSQYDDRTRSSFNNKSLFNNNLSIYQKSDNDIDIQSIEYIFNKCNLSLYDQPYRDLLSNTIVNMYFNANNFSKRKNIPTAIIKGQLMKLNMEITDEALSNFKYALSNNYKIENSNLYFETCLWNAIVNVSIIRIKCVV